jgi:outer membrane protein assembly factor BamB
LIGVGAVFYRIKENGTTNWVYSFAPSLIFSSPGIAADGTIYTSSINPITKIFALTPDGKPKWDFSANSSIFGSVSIGPDGSIYFGDVGENLYSINYDGSLKWIFKSGGAIRFSSCPAIADDGTVIFSSEDGKLYSLNKNGSLKWTFSTARFDE